MVVAVVLVSAPISAGVAGAASSSTPSGVDQYVEQVPTADGHAPAKDRSTPLAKGSVRALERASGPVAAALKEVSTSSAYGAPTTKAVYSASARVPANVRGASFAGSLEEMGSSVVSGGPLGLLIGLSAITVGIALVARKRRRSSS